MNDFKFIEGIDYYLEKGKVIMTEQYLRRRTKCCGSGCRHCCYWPPFVKGNKILRKKDKNLEND